MSDYPRIKIRKFNEAFIIEDGDGRGLAYVYFDDRRDVSLLVRRPSEEEALRIARIIARALAQT